MVLDGLFIYKLLCMYAFFIVGMWVVLRSEEGSNESVNYSPLLLIAVMGAFVFWLIQGVVSDYQELQPQRRWGDI